MHPTAGRSFPCRRLRDARRLADHGGQSPRRRVRGRRQKHFVVGAGEIAQWDADTTTRELAAFVDEAHRFWGFLPYTKYVFLLMFRQGGGGLEHKTSTLSTVNATRPMLGLLSHEYFPLFNVKNLRPVELGPFDYEKPPTTGSLWIAEGVTSYYSSLLVARAGLRTRDEFLASKGAQIGQLQNAPGRLLQSLEQSSREVWNNSNSGVAPAATTVSYYNKGEILGLLLDARIRHATNGRGSFDDVMRLAYKRYAGAKGYTPDDFRAVAEEIAADGSEGMVPEISVVDRGARLFGDARLVRLRFAKPENEASRWSLEVQRCDRGATGTPSRVAASQRDPVNGFVTNAILGGDAFRSRTDGQHSSNSSSECAKACLRT
jgi:predicted metalloprotease with PDZ domain